ncbi:hypothetical protein SAMN04488057_105379 [Cyclobacterium lianum]|uniref:Uncharacterized protein n=1 Tax=Cyclobacterium lianum TaxID=388280 RepID=A0A1M7NJN3_9BACT|nr:hypothetical protein SAMN04488057_105379 [Cyclobacterium lianum]
MHRVKPCDIEPVSRSLALQGRNILFNRYARFEKISSPLDYLAHFVISYHTAFFVFLI